VLLLDDDRDRLLKNEEVLAALGYEPVGFSRVDEALAAFRGTQNRFDAAVVTVRGIANLIDVAIALRRAAAELPIVLAMPISDHADADAFAAARIPEIVCNPLAAIEIAAALARCRAGATHPEHQTIDRTSSPGDIGNTRFPRLPAGVGTPYQIGSTSPRPKLKT
jgi:hypothetical protein